jgi:pimeloyl-ACP methyl ester carboxylesterase
VSDGVKTAIPQRPSVRGKAAPWHHLIVLLEKLSIQLAAFVAMCIWRMTRRYPVPDRERVWLNDASSEFIHVGKRRIRLRRWGAKNRTPVLLVHGWGGRGSQMAAFAGPLVNLGYTVVAPDLPGHGESDGKSTDLHECRHVLQAIQHHSGNFAAIIAHSFGAVVCTYGLREGLSAGACVLVGTPFSGAKIFASYINWLAPPRNVVEQMKKNLENKFGRDVWRLMSPGEHAPHLDTPCLILHDEQDRDVPVESARLLAKKWAGAELVCTRGLGHRRILRDAKCIQLAAEFIADRYPSFSCNQSRHCSNSVS